MYSEEKKYIKYILCNSGLEMKFFGTYVHLCGGYFFLMFSLRTSTGSKGGGVGINGLEWKIMGLASTIARPSYKYVKRHLK